MTLYENKKIYIECGANNGIDQSRSISLIDNPDYVGILIEPDPVVFSECVRNRNNGRTIFFNCALVSPSYKNKFVTLYKHKHWSLMNCLEGSAQQTNNPTNYSRSSIVVPAFTINEILDSLGISTVENFYLDTEGYEVPILKGLSSNLKINHLEVEQHDDTDYEKEKNKIIEVCSVCNLKLIRTENTDSDPNDGRPKLHFSGC